MRRAWGGFLAFFAFACALAAGSGQARAERPDFKLTVSPKEISLGETVTATVTITLPGLAGPDRYWHPAVPDFKIADSQIKRSTQTTVDAKLGQKLQTVEVYRYRLSPKDTGRFLVGPAKIRIGADEWETRQVAVRVRVSGSVGAKTVGLGHTDASELQAPGYVVPTGIHPDVFLYAVADKDKAWVGEQITVSWLLFTRTEVLKYEPTPPRLSGLWSEILFEPTAFFQYSDARVGGRDYVVALVAKRALFASEAGKLSIAPLEARIATVKTALGRAEPIASNSLTVNVKALPEPAPQGFDPSYVGQYSLAATVDRDLLQAGQPLTLSLQIRGQGAIRQTHAPRLTFPDFVFEEPRGFDETLKNRGDLIAGERLYRYWTTPSKGGEQTIPGIELIYFDPQTGQYETARSMPIGITVEGDPGILAENIRKSEAARSVGRDIRLLRTTAQVESRVLVDLYREAWFWWLLCLPPAGYLAVSTIDRFRRRLKKETPRARLRRARGKARAHFRVAEIHLRGGRAPKFFAELNHAIYAHMGEWLGQSMQPMTREEMQAFLAKRGLEGPTVKKVLGDLEAFDRARFAPSAAGPGEMRAAVRRTKELLRAVEKTKLLAGEPEGDKE